MPVCISTPGATPEPIGNTQIQPGSADYRLHSRSVVDAIFSFSLVPLRIGILLGIFFLFLALLETAYVLRFWVAGQEDQLVPGWSSLMFVIIVVGGFLMVILGFAGIYVGYIFQQVKDRPTYVIRRTLNAGSKSVEAGQQELGIKES